VWATMMTNEKPGGHGERSVAVGTIDMAVWDAVAKIEGKPLYQLLAERYGNGKPNRKVFVYAAGRLLLAGPGPRGPGARDAQLPRPRLLGGEEEDRRRVAREDCKRIEPCCACSARAEAGGRRQRPLRPEDRGRVREGAVAVRPVLVRGSRRSARLCAAGRARQPLRRPDGHRREPVLDAGRAQPHPLRRHAARPRLAAVRLRAELWPASSTCARSRC
jgi:hypothetical protein